MTNKFAGTLVAALLLLLCVGRKGLAGAADDMDSGAEPTISIDIPVKLEKADVVFNMNHLVLRGDMSVGLRYMDQLAKALKKAETKNQIIGIFYNEAGHFTLNDAPYNTFRGVNTGNPYKTQIADLIKQGIQIEECAETMKSHHWGNEDLLPGVKVNSGAVGRLVQLTQQGFVQIQP